MPYCLRFLGHTRPTGRTTPNELSARRRGRYLHDTQQTNARDETNNQALCGIRTRTPNSQADEDPRLGHRYRHTNHVNISYPRLRFSYLEVLSLLLIVATRSKAWVFGRSLAAIAGSNPARGMDVCCVVWCQVEVSASG